MGVDRPEAVGGHLYDYLGIESKLLDANTVETSLPGGDDFPAGGAARAAAFGLAMEHGMPLLARVAAVPVVITVHLRRPSGGPGRLRVASRIARLGRTVLVTEGTFSGAGGLMTGFGTITWSVSGPLTGNVRTSTPPAPDFRDGQATGLPEAVGLRPLEGEQGYRIAAVTPAIAGPGGILHAGAVQFLCEEAALDAARRGLPADRVCTRDFVCHLLRAGRNGPFTSQATVLAAGDDGVDCRAEVRDEGSDGRLIARAQVRSAPL